MSYSPKLECPLMKGQENGHAAEDEHKRIESVGSAAKAIAETDAPTGSRRNPASEHTPNQTFAESLSSTRCGGLDLKAARACGNNRLSESLKKQTLNLLKTKYQGFGPTLAHEKLVEKDKQKSISSSMASPSPSTAINTAFFE